MLQYGEKKLSERMVGCRIEFPEDEYEYQQHMKEAHFSFIFPCSQKKKYKACR